jgi:magnesium chelatase family protein
MLVQVNSAALQGISAKHVRIEVHLSRGIRFSLVGLPDNAVRESHERIVSSLQVNGMDLPRKQIVINMSPADVRKEGTSYDVPLLVGIMAAGGYLPADALEDCLFMGELSLDGKIRPIRGALSIALLAVELKLKRLIVPAENAAEAAVVQGLRVYGVNDITDILTLFRNPEALTPHPFPDPLSIGEQKACAVDFSDVKGQLPVKRALEVACAGGHNLLMIGPPGAGKSLMAKCLPGILPPMNLHESLETTRIYSVSGKTNAQHALLRERPFRSPHHSISSVALVGGGSKAQPGEISLAHNGVLFLDELPEFNRSALEVMRQPLEDGSIRIARAAYTLEYPAEIMLVASMNPCPCGYYNHPDRECVCTPGQRQKYLARISGPLMDRIDLHIEIAPISYDELSSRETAESSESIRQRIVAARERQLERFQMHPQTTCNARMTPRQIKHYIQMEHAAHQLLKNAMPRLKLSARAYDRIVKVAQTIADLEGNNTIRAEHVAEAILYRSLDRENWGK